MEEGEEIEVFPDLNVYDETINDDTVTKDAEKSATVIKVAEKRKKSKTRMKDEEKEEREF